jgi:uncharacterized OsmC-like protein|tara:strand:+ start:3149 stop:3556 length:408 start_codon:yes stop_codon:yes gene_type:complete
MTVELKPKVFGPIFVFFNGTDTLQYAHIDPSNASAYPPIQAPVDTFLASLGACIVMSIKWSTDQRKFFLNPFIIKVVGIKAFDIPNRIERINIEIIGKFIDNEDLIPRIMRQAKLICTVSNSLSCEVNFTARTAL